MADRKSFVLYFDIRGPLEQLSDEERGKLFLSLFDYAEQGKIPQFTGALGMAFEFIRCALDRDAERWEVKRTCRAEAGRRGGLAKLANATLAKQNNQSLANLAVPVPVPVPVNENIPPISPKGGKSERFKPPTEDEVRAYCSERKNGIDAGEFVNHYESTGWVVGKSPMRDWRAAVRTWERRRKEKQPVDNFTEGF